MSHTFTSIDTTTLPAAMLAMTKKHLRVDVDEDDATITEYLAWAISFAEKFWELQVFAAAVNFMPAGGASTYACPVRPVSAFTAADAGGDVTADYLIESASLTEPVWIVRADGDVFPANVTFSLTAGYAALTDLSPAMRGNILRIAATMYEHRETVTTETVDQVPYWLNDMMGGLWVPRA
jgi:uncharacterized phiE125 gp8 family phage protein